MNTCIKNRVQVFDSQRQAWVKYNTLTGAAMQIKKNGKPFSRIKAVAFETENDKNSA